MTFKSKPVEVQVNQFFIAVAISLIAAAISAFLWLAGFLEWRGTTTDTDIRLTLECGDPSKIASRFDAAIDLEDDENEGHTSSIAFGFSVDDDEFRASCKHITIETSRVPLRIVDAGTVDAPGDDTEVRAQVDTGPVGEHSPLYQTRVGLSKPFYTATIDAPPRLKLLYRHDDLMRFIGLSEREVNFSFNVSVKTSDLAAHQSKSMTFALRPPEGFSVASSDVPLRLEGSRYWATDTFIEGDTNSISLKDSSMARLDHIIDASISSVLGAGVGALLASWLNLQVKRSLPDR